MKLNASADRGLDMNVGPTRHPLRNGFAQSIQIGVALSAHFSDGGFIFKLLKESFLFGLHCGSTLFGLAHVKRLFQNGVAQLMLAAAVGQA